MSFWSKVIVNDFLIIALLWSSTALSVIGTHTTMFMPPVTFILFVDALLYISASISDVSEGGLYSKM
jgi:hypothetical protein